MKTIIYGHPDHQQRHRTTRVSGKVINYDPSKKDKAVFREQAKRTKPDTPYKEAIKLYVRAYFKRPKSHYVSGDYKKGLKANAPFFCTKTPDCDNILKFVQDALNGVFWLDDKFIAAVDFAKLYDDKPRIEFYVKELTL